MRKKIIWLRQVFLTLFMLISSTESSLALTFHKWIEPLEKLVLMDYETVKCPKDSVLQKATHSIFSKAKTCKDLAGDLTTFYSDKKGSIVGIKHVQIFKELNCNKKTMAEVFQLKEDKISYSESEGKAWFDLEPKEVMAGSVKGFSRGGFQCSQQDHSFVESIYSHEQKKSKYPNFAYAVFPSDNVKFGMSVDQVLQNTKCTPIKLTVNLAEKGESNIRSICKASDYIDVGHLVEYTFLNLKLATIRFFVNMKKNDKAIKSILIDHKLNPNNEFLVENIKRDFKIKNERNWQATFYKNGLDLAGLKKLLPVSKKSMKTYYNDIFKRVKHLEYQQKDLEIGMNKMLKGQPIETAFSIFEDFSTCSSGAISFVNVPGEISTTIVNLGGNSCLGFVNLIF